MSDIYTLQSTDLINQTFDDINDNFTNLNTDKADKVVGLQQFASTTSAQLDGVISDSLGEGSLLFGNALDFYKYSIVTSVANLIVNNSFETNLSGWSGWLSASFTRDTTEYYHGVASAKIVTDGNTYAQGCYSAVTTKVGSTYAYSCYVKGTAGKQITMFIDGGTYPEIYKTLTGGWDRITGSVTATSTNTSIYIQCRTAGVTTYWLDAVQVEEGTTIAGPFTTTQGNLTVALKNFEGNDPTATKPVKIQIGGVIRTITSACYINATIAGTNWGNAGSTELATKEIDWFVYILDYNNSGAVFNIGISRYPLYNNLSEATGLFTSEKYLIQAGNIGIENVVNIGRFNATLSVGGAYTWSIPATSVIINSPCYETRELNIGGDIQGFSSLSTQTIYYQLEGSKVSYKYAIGGTSNATNLTFRLPFNKNANVYDTDTLCSLTLDNGVNLDNPGRAEINSSYGYGFANILKTMSGGAWTASGYKLVRGQGFYNI